MLESKLTSRGRTTLPKAVREALQLKPGERVRYVIQGNQVLLLPSLPVERLFGMLKHDGPPVTLEDMDRAIGDSADE